MQRSRRTGRLSHLSWHCPIGRRRLLAVHASVDSLGMKSILRRLLRETASGESISHLRITTGGLSLGRMNVSVVTLSMVALAMVALAIVSLAMVALSGVRPKMTSHGMRRNANRSILRWLVIEGGGRESSVGHLHSLRRVHLLHRRLVHLLSTRVGTPHGLSVLVLRGSVLEGRGLLLVLAALTCVVEFDGPIQYRFSLHFLHGAFAFFFQTKLYESISF